MKVFKSKRILKSYMPLFKDSFARRKTKSHKVEKKNS